MNHLNAFFKYSISASLTGMLLSLCSLYLYYSYNFFKYSISASLTGYEPKLAYIIILCLIESTSKHSF